MPTTRRFFEPTRPYEHRVREFGRQLAKLTAANLAFAPSCHIWLPPNAPSSSTDRLRFAPSSSQVIVDEAARLHRGVGRGGPDETETTALEVL